MFLRSCRVKRKAGEKMFLGGNAPYCLKRASPKLLIANFFKNMLKWMHNINKLKKCQNSQKEKFL